MSFTVSGKKKTQTKPWQEERLFFPPFLFPDVYDATLFKWKVARREADWFQECPEPGRKTMAAIKKVVTHRWFEYAVCKCGRTVHVRAVPYSIGFAASSFLMATLSSSPPAPPRRGRLCERRHPPRADILDGRTLFLGRGQHLRPLGLLLLRSA